MKISGSALLNIVLATILMTSLFFMGAGLNTSGVDEIASAIEYDPWIDINDDGVIDGQDYQKIRSLIPSSGDSTKHVIIAGRNWSQFTYEFYLTPLEEGNLTILTAGYEQITLGFKRHPMPWPHFGNVTVATGFLVGNLSIYVYVDRFNVTMGWTGSQLPILPEYPVVRTYDIRGPLFTIAFYNPNNDTDMNLWIVGYITT